MSGKLILVRGLPGSGKSRLARSLVCDPYHWEADMFFCRTFDEFGNEDGYLELAESRGWDLIVIRCLGKYQSIHGVPEKVIEEMRQRWQDYPKEVTAYPFITKEIK